jgi:hypothetical protein
VSATVGPGEIIILDKDKQAELEASGQTEDLAALNRDADKAYEITKDKYVEIEYYLSDTSVKAALEAGKSVAEIVVDASGRMANEGKLTSSDYAAAVKLAAYKDDPAVLEQLAICAQRQSSIKQNIFEWIFPSAHAAGSCSIDLPNGKTEQISPEGARNCVGVFDAGKALVVAFAFSLEATQLLLKGTSDSQSYQLNDDTVLKIYGAEYSSKPTAEVTLQDGSKAALQFTTDGSGNLLLQSGTINGKPMSLADLRNTVFALQANGSKNVILSQSSEGSSPSKGGATSGSGGAAAGAPDPDDNDPFKRPNDNLQKGDRVNLNQFEQRVKVDGEVRYQDPKSG